MSQLRKAVAAKDILSWDEARLISFLKSCSANDDSDLDLSEAISDVDRLPTPERDELGLKLNAAVKKLSDKSLDPSELSKRLEAVRDEIEPARTQSSSRSPTHSPPPRENNIRLESISFHDLVRRQGRPSLPIGYLSGEVEEEQRKKQQLLWVDSDYELTRDDDVPPVFSCQLEDWLKFQQRWQWDNRGKANSGEGYREYLESETKYFCDKGYAEWALTEDFASGVSYMWKKSRARLALECPSQPGLTAYTEAVNQRLSSHGFLTSVEFLEDPRKQDMWTTWVEYLDYMYYWQDSYSSKLARAEDKSSQAWETFEKNGWVRQGMMFPGEPTFVQLGSSEERLAQANSELEARAAAVHKLLQDIAPYRRWERLLRRQEKRAAWVMEQISLIESEREGSGETTTEQIPGERESEAEVKTRSNLKETEVDTASKDKEDEVDTTSKDKEDEVDAPSKAEEDKVDAPSKDKEGELDTTPKNEPKNKGKQTGLGDAAEPQSHGAEAEVERPRSPKRKTTDGQLTDPPPRRSQRLAANKDAEIPTAQEPEPSPRTKKARKTSKKGPKSR